jgi:hypothetical protein
VCVCVRARARARVCVCVCVLARAEYDCLVEMVHYVGEISTQVLGELAQSKENSVVDCFLSD